MVRFVQMQRLGAPPAQVRAAMERAAISAQRIDAFFRGRWPPHTLTAAQLCPAVRGPFAGLVMRRIVLSERCLDHAFTALPVCRRLVQAARRCSGGPAARKTGRSS